MGCRFESCWDATYPELKHAACRMFSSALKWDGTAREDALFKDANKGDWAFVVACVAVAIVCSVWSVKLGTAHYKAQHNATEFSSSQRPAK